MHIQNHCLSQIKTTVRVGIHNFRDWPIVPRIVFDQMTASIPEIVDGSSYTRTHTLAGNVQVITVTMRYTTDTRNSNYSPVLHIGTSSTNFLLLIADEPEVKECLLHLQARAPITTRKSSTAVPVPASSSICWRLSTVISPTTPRLTRTDNNGLLTAEAPGLTA